MNLEPLVKAAQGGDVKAFVELTRRFQHFAFGSALALVRDFQLAEDVVQEAFVAAWSSLPGLADPAAFPGWLRGIVRHQAFRVLRRRHLENLPLSAADDVASDEPAPDHQLDQRQQATAVLAAMAGLPAGQREVASLFFVHECSHQDIATFLGLPVATVNNRLHAARTHLKRRMLTMVKATLGSHALPDDFANRIGRLLTARGGVVEALFNPDALPDLMAELAISDEANRRGITVQVVQRPGGGIVRGVAVTPVDVLPRGATVLDARRPNRTPVSVDAFQRSVKLLIGEQPATDGTAKLLATGIKAIDVMCPLRAGGTVAIAGELGAGITVVMEELVRRLSGGNERVTLFNFVPHWLDAPAGHSMAEALKQEGYSEGTVGAVQSFFLRAEDGPWSAERLAALSSVDTVIHLSRAQATAGIYPTVDPLTSRSCLLESGAAGHQHVAIAQRVREAIAALRQAGDQAPVTEADAIMLQRARKVAQFFGQPFYVAEPYIKRSGTTVGLAEALRVCREILDGDHDDQPVEAFWFAGGIAEIRGRPDGFTPAW
ncbi:MAG TPA: sigma-70 family RNA polymerase sigma factor [Vineibacter sp.]|nr:sigma-70 family RNA polymerase sigma factor [Vineibacter sp.]